ncbi:MAG: four helix bundle protein [bacterium]
MSLVELVYRAARELPESERYGLRSQMTRAAVSIPANIAEGHGSNHRRVYLNHLSISRGSLAELQTYLTLAERLQILSPTQTAELQQKARLVGRLLNGLIRALRTPRPLPPDP